MDVLRELRVPVLIFSAGVADVVEEVFRQHLPDARVSVISVSFARPCVP